MKETVLMAKAIKFHELKFVALEKALGKLNTQIYEEYKAEFEKLKIEHKHEIDLLDDAMDTLNKSE